MDDTGGPHALETNHDVPCSDTAAIIAQLYRYVLQPYLPISMLELDEFNVWLHYHDTTTSIIQPVTQFSQLKLYVLGEVNLATIALGTPR